MALYKRTIIKGGDLRLICIEKFAKALQHIDLVKPTPTHPDSDTIAWEVKRAPLDLGQYLLIENTNNTLILTLVTVDNVDRIEEKEICETTI
ncbi:MAG: hypothetical protein PHF44_03620 [Candidatus Pacebacteria bacterium]|nr:hypothetical protein [Candidatus Paceibacterota bacterium]